MALSGIELSAGIVVGVNKPVDGKYGPYATLAAAKADIGVTLRYLGLTVGITTAGVVEDYWWESGTADVDLVAKGGGIPDGDKGDIVVSSGGTVWTIENASVTNERVAAGIDAIKIANGNVTNTEFQYLDGVTSAVQTQIDTKISTYDGATYDVTALAAVSQAEYDAIVTKSATTLYFII